MAEQSLDSFTEQHRLGLKLRPIMVGELHLAKSLDQPVFIFKGGVFMPVIAAGSAPSKESIHALIKNSIREVFVYREDLKEIKKNLETALIKVTRSLSVGDPLENGTRDLKLISLNLNGLYQNPHDDELLMLQFQSSQNLSKFLIEQKKHLPAFYQNLLKENFHFTLSQPMLSSLLLLSFLQATHLFHEREIENLFLASYLKDLGFAMIPDNKYDIKSLTPKDQDLFADHADFSFDLLDGRLPLSKNYLTIIKHHHFLNDKIKVIVGKTVRSAPDDSDVIHGLESTLVAVFDIIVAMTSERPYRKGMPLFQTLEVVRKLMADDYPQEFKAIVIFLKNFFRN